MRAAARQCAKGALASLAALQRSSWQKQSSKTATFRQSLQCRRGSRAMAPKLKAHEEVYYKNGEFRPWMFPVVDCMAEGRSAINLSLAEPKSLKRALTLMELKTKFLDAKVREGDAVRLVFDGLSAGEIVGVSVLTGVVGAGINQHVIAVEFRPSEEFAELRDSIKMPIQDW